MHTAPQLRYRGPTAVPLLSVLLILVTATGAGTVTDQCDGTAAFGLAARNNSHLFTTDQAYTVCLPSHLSTTNSTTGPGDFYLQGPSEGGYHVSLTGGDIAVNFSSSLYTVENVTTSCSGSCVFLFSMARQNQSHVGQQGYGRDVFIALGGDPFTVTCLDCIRPSRVTELGQLVTVDPAITGPEYNGTVCLSRSCSGGGVCRLDGGRCTFTATERLDGIQPVWLRLEGDHITSVHRLGLLQNDNFLRFGTSGPIAVRHGRMRSVYLRIHNLNDRQERFTLELSDPRHLYPAFRGGGQSRSVTLEPGAERSMAIDLRTEFCPGSCAGNLTVTLTGQQTGTTETETRRFRISPDQQAVSAPALQTPQLLVLAVLAVAGRLALT